MHQRCLAEVAEQEILKDNQNELRRQIVEAFTAICVDSCESIVIRPLLGALNLLDEGLLARQEFGRLKDALLNGD